jgi:hypothetical protein
VQGLVNRAGEKTMACTPEITHSSVAAARCHVPGQVHASAVESRANCESWIFLADPAVCAAGGSVRPDDQVVTLSGRAAHR